MKLYKSYRKYLFKRDTLLSTISVFLLIGLLALLPLNTNIFNPIKTALVDFDFNDIAYAKLGKNSDTRLDDRIVIVNIGDADRAQIAGMLELVNGSKPKAIGLDVEFKEAREETADAMLLQAIQRTPNMVGASRLNWKEKEGIEYRGYFANAIPDYGYVNFIGEDAGTIRFFSPREKANGQEYLCFASALIKKGDPEIYNKQAKRDRHLERIHYKRRTAQYHVVNGYDLLEGKVSPNLFQNKYVLMGYINEDIHNVEDKHFTPMNASFAGKSLPDMNGVVIHANIISMMLDSNFVRKMPGWLNWLITIAIAWLHVALFIRYYVDDHLWFHLAAKVAQVISAIIFVFLSIMLFHWVGLELDMKMPLIVIILAIDVIYFYEAFALWMHKKYGFSTVFNHKTH